MTLTIKLDDKLVVTNKTLEFDDNDNYCGRAAKLAALEQLASELVSDEELKNKVVNYCQNSIEKLYNYDA